MEITVSSLTHSFPGRDSRPALQGVSFQIPSGQFVAIVGPSGCGKSTLLRILANLIQPTAGQARLNEKTPAQAVAGRQVAWMAQSPALLPWLTAEANVAMAGRFLPSGKTRLSPLEALSLVGLSDSAGAYPFMLSGGMQQRLALARILSMQAQAWLMDEPFAALDELTREHLTTELLDLWRLSRPTVLWVTHNLSESLRLADRVIVLSQRPARVAADFAVRLPRPRDDASPDFTCLLKELRKALSDERTN